MKNTLTVCAYTLQEAHLKLQEQIPENWLLISIIESEATIQKVRRTDASAEIAFKLVLNEIPNETRFKDKINKTDKGGFNVLILACVNILTDINQYLNSQNDEK